MALIYNYKRCPLKKRPIVYEDNVADEPQDLSMKRKASDDIKIEEPPIKRQFILNLSKSATNDDQQEMPLSLSLKYRPDSPISLSSITTTSSVLLSPQAELDSSTMHMQLPSASPLQNTTNIHLRGLTNATAGYTTTNSYQTAFVMAAGCNPITALWNNYQPTNISAIYPSPASSIASLSSPHSTYSSYQQMTPPSSPGTDDLNASEPEDLSIRSDIPLPALYHIYGETNNNKQYYTVAGTTEANQHKYGASSGGGVSKKCANIFNCDKCNKDFATSNGLAKHQQFHCPAAECNQEKKQHACQDCGKLYTTIGALKMHIRTHTLPCKCPICGKAFSRPWLLQGHIRTHTGEKPFKCNECPRSFADRSNLRAHQQTHVEVKKYACRICNKSFSRMSLLNKHNSTNCTITVT